jgi:hypothetical protein
MLNPQFTTPAFPPRKVDPVRRAFLVCEENDSSSTVRSRKVIGDLAFSRGGDVVKYDLCDRDGRASHFRKLAGGPAQKKLDRQAIDLETRRFEAPRQEQDGVAASRLVVYEAV